MGDFSQSGIGAATGGANAVLGLQKNMQEAAVRPRELEAATSYAESRATEAKAKIASMQEMAGLQDVAASKLKASGEAMTLANANKYQIRELIGAGKAEEASKLQKLQSGLEKDYFETTKSALDVDESRNELAYNQLDGVDSVYAYKELAKSALASARSRIESGQGTQEDAMRIVGARQALASAEAWEKQDPNGDNFADFKRLEVDPKKDALKTAKQKAIEAKNLVDAENRKIQLQETERHNREMEVVRLKEAATQRENQAQSKTMDYTIKLNAQTAKYELARQKIQAELDLLEPTKSTWMGLGADEDNPEYVKGKERLDRLDAVHNDNLAGMQEAANSGKVFVPRSYESILTSPAKETKTPDVKIPTMPAGLPAGSQYSPSTKTWWFNGKKVG